MNKILLLTFVFVVLVGGSACAREDSKHSHNVAYYLNLMINLDKLEDAIDGSGDYFDEEEPAERVTRDVSENEISDEDESFKSKFKLKLQKLARKEEQKKHKYTINKDHSKSSQEGKNNSIHIHKHMFSIKFFLQPHEPYDDTS